MFSNRLQTAIQITLLLTLSTIWTGCTHLLYHPSTTNYANKPSIQEKREEVEFKSTDGTALVGWFFPCRTQKPCVGTVVQFHGNAQNMTAHFTSLFWLGEEGYNLLAFDYRGYGISEGKPFPEGMNRDALAAISYAARRTSDPGSKKNIFLYGQSLGGAILMRSLKDLPAAEKNRVAGVVIESSFHDYHSISRDMLARNWLTFLLQPLAYVLMSNQYAPADEIPNISPIPLLVIHGDQDRVVPFRFGEKVFELAREPKQFLRIPAGGHINSMQIVDGKYRAELLRFFQKTERNHQ